MSLRRTLVGGTVLALLAGGGYAAWAQASEQVAAYRTAKVSRGDVEQQLDLTGTLAATGTHDLSFGASGTVATVDVTVGQQVRQGQQLGALDRTALRTADQKARATLAAAEAQLEDDEATQADQVAAADDSSDSSSSGSSGSDHPSADPTFQPGQGSTDEPSSGPDPMELLHQQQEAVTTAQTTASTALAAAQDALTHETETCTASPGEQICADALAAVQTAQQQVATAQTALEDAIEALTETLAQALKQLEQQSSTEPTQQPSQEPSQQPTQQPSQQPSTDPEAEASQGPTITAATLARDQASIEQAKAEVVDADQALAGAVVTAPQAGRVVQVDVEQGGSATAGGSAFVVVAPGTTTVTLSVSDTQLRSLAVHQSATVTPVGSEHGYRAKVTYVDPVPDTSTDTTTYAVTVTLDKQRLSLPNGAPALVSVVVGEATGVLTVPTSAVSNGTVKVLQGGEVTARRVTTGIVGTTRTEVTDGLSLGDEVVVADLNQALPSSDNQENEFRGPTGGFGGNAPVVVGGPGGGPGGGPVVQGR